VLGVARICFEVIIPEKNKSGISSSVNYLTSNLGTATASGISLLFLLGDCCHNKFIVA
jgi:hypothetical protein